jgi:hypothetical protein
MAVTRRAVLSGVVLGGTTALGLSGCSKKRPQELKPHPDVAVLLGAIATEERLIAMYESTRKAHPDLARRLDPLLAHHRDHLTVLRRHYVPGTGSSTTPSPGPTAAQSRPAQPRQTLTGATEAAPGDRRQAVAALRLTEHQAAAARSDEVTRVSPGLAQLFASIGACEAGHAAWLTRVS